MMKRTRKERKEKGGGRYAKREEKIEEYEKMRRTSTKRVRLKREE
jgi:hypothetical protein